MSGMTVASGGASLAVRQWGQGGSPIVALHTGVGDSRIWEACAPAWVSAGYRVTAFDRRGFGQTEYAPEPHDDMADLMAVCGATDASPAAIVGNSMGGALALDYALAAPDVTTALILIAPGASGYDYSRWPTSEAEQAQDALIAHADKAGDIDLVNRLELRYWLDGVDQPEGRVVGEPRALFSEMNERALRAPPVGDAAKREPVWGRLGEIRVPTLVVVGEYDLPGVLQMGAEIAEAMPRGELLTLEGTAHCPSLDTPNELNRAVLEFLGSLAV